MDKLLQAIDFATVKHLDQKRKDKKTPAISHVLAVGLILSQITNDKEIVVAGVLHDVLEDTDTSKEEIRQTFGERVLKLVDDVSEEDKTLDWATRKNNVLKKIAGIGRDSAMIKAADTLHNMYTLMCDVKKNGQAFFGNFNANKTDKLAYERKRLAELKKYYGDIAILDDVGTCLDFLES